MREIKFRGWSKEYNQMFTHQMMETSMKEILVFVEKHKGIKAPGGIFLPTLDPDLELMQYSGIKDKNGKEIYEGDIVYQEFNDPRPLEQGGFIGVIRMLEGCWVIDNQVNHAEQLWSETNEVEVLGNVHENPELMEAMENESSH